MKLLNSRKKVLVLDKDNTMVDAVDDLLQTGKWEILIINDAGNVYDQALVYHPDLVVMDYRMLTDKCAGICNKLNSHPQLRPVPVIVISSKRSGKIKTAEYNCQAIFLKPYDMGTLVPGIDYLMAS
jgi:DNA-binding response OmpR family regulator